MIIKLVLTIIYAGLALVAYKKIGVIERKVEKEQYTEDIRILKKRIKEIQKILVVGAIVTFLYTILMLLNY